MSRTIVIDSYPQFVKINKLFERGKLKMWFLSGCTFIWQWEENSIVTVCNRHMSSSCRRICWTHGFVSLKFCERILSFEHFQISDNPKQLKSANICLHRNLILLDTFSLTHLASFYWSYINEREHWWRAYTELEDAQMDKVCSGFRFPCTRLTCFSIGM